MIKSTLLFSLLLNSKSFFSLGRIKDKDTGSSIELPIYKKEKRAAISQTSWNVLTHNYHNDTDYYENFNPNGYSLRNGHSGRWINANSEDIDCSLHYYGQNDDGEEMLHTNGFNPQYHNVESNDSLSGEQRAIQQITDPKVFPYKFTGFIQCEYDHPGFEEGKTYAGGTAFIVGYNVIVTSAHITYSYVPTLINGSYTYDYRFPDRIYFFAGLNGDNDYNNCLQTMAWEVSVPKDYIDNPYESSNSFSNNDWSAIMTDDDIGASGYYPIMSNWYSYYSNVYTYGYTDFDINDYKMYYSSGKLKSKTDYIYKTSVSSSVGNSGGALFKDVEMASGLLVSYVIGIVSGKDSFGNTIVTRLNTFNVSFLNSFMTSYWPTC